MKYLPYIDGLRALAVTSVIAFHISGEAMPNGYLGVDIFFVISGYLITLIIHREMDKGEFSFAQFWARRVRRILPVIGTMVTLTLLAYAVLGFPGAVVGHAKTALASVLMVANFYIPMSFGDYWGDSAENSLFLHMWSLGVEEQFYLLLPFFLFLMHRWVAQSLVLVLTFLCLASLGLFVYSAEHAPDIAFYMLPTRAWELGFGCLIAVLRYTPSSKQLSDLFTLSGLLFILLAFVIQQGPYGISVFNAVLAVVGTGVVIKAGGEGYIAKVALGNRVMTWVGKLSFSLYVWHYPVLIIGNQISWASDQSISIWLITAIITALSVGSYYCVERPVRHLKGSISIPLLFPAAALTTAIAFICLWAPVLESPNGYIQPSYAGPFYDLSPIQPNDRADTIAKRESVVMTSRPKRDTPLYKSAGLRLDYGSEAKIMLLGDSHALMWAEAFNSIAERNEYDLLVSGMSSTLPFNDFVAPDRLEATERATLAQRREIAMVRRQVVAEWQPDVVVVATRTFPSDATIDAFVEYFKARSTALLFLTSPPVLDFGNNGAHHILSYIAQFRSIEPKAPVGMLITDEHLKKNARLARIEWDCSCHILNLSPYLMMDEKHSTLAAEGVILYYDDDHLSTAGTKRFAPLIEAKISEILSSI